jgi:hypothetical protein
MLTPYEFGYVLEKQARGMLADAALYSNPWTGVPTGIYDTYNSLRKGQYLGALGNVASTATSLVGGGMITGGLKSIGGGLMRAGARAGASTLLPQAARGAVQTGLHVAGRGALTAGRALGVAGGAAAGRLGDSAQQAVARGVQKFVPVRAGATFMKSPVRAAVNVAVRNPIDTAAFFLHNGDSSPSPPGRAPVAHGAQQAGQLSMPQR